MAKMGIVERVSQSQNDAEDSRNSLEILIQLYADKSHFIYELLQNAEDAGASKIKFEQYADRLVVIHDGHPFSESNLEALRGVGRSDKIGDLNKIGQFGVGFKSVFSICNNVLLYSHPSLKDLDKGYEQFATRIVDFRKLEIIEDQRLESGYTTMFVFPYCVGLSFSSFKTLDELNEKLSERLQNLGITTLLFMKNLQSIDYRIELTDLKKSGTYQLKKERINDHCCLVSAIDGVEGKEDNEEESYIVFSRPVKIDSGEIQMVKTVDIAFAVKVEDSGEYTFIPLESPNISVYFPTDTESKLKFIVHGPYRTAPNRGNLSEDDMDNISLAKQTTFLLRDSAIELRDLGKLNLSFLNILPVDSKAFGNKTLFKCMFDMTVDMLKTEKLLPCKYGSYASADRVRLARNSELAELFTDKLYNELLSDEKEYHWLSTDLTENNKTYLSLYAFMIGDLGIKVIRPEDLKDAFNNNPAFLPQRDDEWLVRLYRLYETLPYVFNRTKNSPMLTAEIIKTSKGEFIAPYRKIVGSDRTPSYLPNIFLHGKNTDDQDDIALVDESIRQQCRNFFEITLNLKEPDEYDLFITNFKKRSGGGNAVSDEQHIKDLKRLVHYLSTHEHHEEITDLMEKFLKVRCRKEGNIIYANPASPANPATKKVLFPVSSDGLNIEMYYSPTIIYPYVDFEFYKNNGVDRDMLKKLKISEDVALYMDDTDGLIFNGVTHRYNKWSISPDSPKFRKALTLDRLDKILDYIFRNPNSDASKEKSRFIFKFLQNNEDKLVGMVSLGKNSPYESDTSDIVKKLRKKGNPYQYYGMNWDGKWLFTKSGELVSPIEITKWDLDPGIYGDVRPKSKLYDYLEFSKNDEEQFEEAEKVYDQLDDKTKALLEDIVIRRRLGMSITDLEDHLNLDDKSDSISTLSASKERSSEFPSKKVKNWELLRRHVIEAFAYADPVTYEKKLRSFRVSTPDSEIRAYLSGMYKIDGSSDFACQMCHDHFPRFERYQISKKMDEELRVMYLCMCPNCASELKALFTNSMIRQEFIDKIKKLTKQDIDSHDPVKIDIGDKSIWFTQTHIAEIKELLALKDAAGEDV